MTIANLTGLVLQFSESVFEKCYNLISFCSFQGKSFKIPELSAMFIIMTTHQHMGNLKQMQDIITVIKLHLYLTRYAHLNKQHF